MKRWTAGAKTIAVSAAGLLVTAGLCKLGQFEDSTHHDGAPGWFDILGGLALVVSSLLLFAGVVVVAIEVLAHFRRRSS
jgi:hypothetical protein